MRKKQWPPRMTLHRASGQARVRVNGKDHYLGPWNSDEARAAYARLVTRLAEDRPAEDPALAGGALTVADVVAIWLEVQAPRCSERGREGKAFRRAFQVLLALHRTTRADTFGVDDLEDVRSAMASGSWMSEKERANLAKRGQRPGWCARVCARMIGRIRTFWRWAERKKHVPEGSWAHLCSLPPIAPTDPTVRRTGDVRACTEAELELVCGECVPPVAAMLRLQYLAGMRSGEVRTMRAGDVDRSADDWVYRPRQHKNDWRGQVRLVVLGPQAREILTPWLLGKGADDYLFAPVVRQKHDHYSDTGYAQAVRRAARDAGVDGFHPYRARHAAKQRITRELGLEAARAALGQKSIETTASYAAETDLELAKKAARKTG